MNVKKWTGAVPNKRNILSMSIRLRFCNNVRQPSATVGTNNTTTTTTPKREKSIWYVYNYGENLIVYMLYFDVKMSMQCHTTLREAATPKKK